MRRNPGLRLDLTASEGEEAGGRGSLLSPTSPLNARYTELQRSKMATNGGIVASFEASRPVIEGEIVVKK